MPRKPRELQAELRRAGFIPRAAKGNHTVWEHPLVPAYPSRWLARAATMPTAIKKRRSAWRWRRCARHKGDSSHDCNF